MTDRLAEIQVRLYAAWRGHDWAVVGGSVAEVYHPDILQPIAENVHPVDATFIANAPTDIAYLLERVRELEAGLKGIAQFDPRWMQMRIGTFPNREQLIERAYDALAAALTEGESNE